MTCVGRFAPCVESSLTGSSENGSFLFLFLGSDQKLLISGVKPPRKNSGLSRVEEVTFIFVTEEQIQWLRSFYIGAMS